MKRLVCEKPGSLRFEELKDPPISKDLVRVKVHGVGLCGTDYHAFDGNQPYFEYPRVLGHEIGGEIVTAGKYFEEGASVVVYPYFYCGECSACKAGRTNCCRKLNVFGVHIDGGMQDYIEIPEHYLVETVLDPAESAILEPLAIGRHAVMRAGISAGQYVLVAGAGPIGTGIAYFASQVGASVIVSDFFEQRLERVSSICDVRTSTPKDLEDVVRDATNDQGVKFAFDATGNSEVMSGLVRLIDHGGKLILVGLSPDNVTFSHPQIHARELSILCSRNATMDDFLKVKSVLEQGDFPVSQYISKSINPDEIPEIMKNWKDTRNETLKVLVRW